MKTASIIIPTFNRAHLVARAIESAINQTYPCEIVVCDHGSTDNTPEIMVQYQDKIRYIRREEDKGPIICWQDGVEQATGEVVNILFDDDWLEPTFMEETIAKLDDDIGFVYTGHRCQVADRILLGRKHRPGVGDMKDIVIYLMIRCVISPSCAIFRRKDVLKNLLLQIPNAQGIYGKDSGVGEDLLLFLLTARDYPKYVHIPKPLACFLNHPDSITIKAGLSGHTQVFLDAYARARVYYFSFPGSIQPPTKLQKMIFAIKWSCQSGILAEVVLEELQKKIFGQQYKK